MKKPTQNLDNYRRVSKPPKAGDPIITAIVITLPKRMPTSTKRLFIPKFCTSQLKIDWTKIRKRFGRRL